MIYSPFHLKVGTGIPGSCSQLFISVWRVLETLMFRCDLKDTFKPWHGRKEKLRMTWPCQDEMERDIRQASKGR